MAAAWADVLAARARAGRSSQPPYDHTGQDPALGRTKCLLGANDKVGHRFSGIIGGRGEPFWELLTADEQGVLTLGASFRRSGANGTFQAADALYYASGGYYAGLTLYQMWPVDVGGRPATLVWRGDFISSAAVASLHGIERVASESALMREFPRPPRYFGVTRGSPLGSLGGQLFVLMRIAATTVAFCLLLAAGKSFAVQVETYSTVEQGDQGRGAGGIGVVDLVRVRS